MVEKVSVGLMFLCTVKDIWDTLKDMYNNEKNISRVFELYEQNISRVFELYKQLFTLRIGDRSLFEYYSTLKGVLDELNVHQPLVTDLRALKEYMRN